MGIVFFENFEQDTQSSILLRYPGSRKGESGAPLPNCFPLQRLAVSNAAANDAILEFLTPVEPQGRLDIYLELEDNGNTASTHANNMLVFCNNLVVRGVSATSFQIYPVSAGTAQTVAVSDLKAVQKIYMSVDYTNQILIVLVDGDLAFRGAMNWTWVDGAINNLIVDATTNSIQNTWFPNMLRSIVIAADLPAGQMLDQSSISFLQTELATSQVTDMEFSDAGYVEDVGKDDPELRTPGVFAVDEGSIVYETEAAPNSLGAKIYTAGRSDKARYMEVGEPGGAVERLTPNITVYPAFADTRQTVRVAVTEGQPWISNGQGMEWGGEVNLISYADLSSRVGFSAGMLMAENTWLKVRLDGVEMYVAKTPVRHAVSWSQLYAAGLVYGMEGPGISPGSPAVDQMVTVEIGSRLFKVRLLKGADTDPSAAAAGNDTIGTHNSEWTRIFAPIGPSPSVFPSYTGPKFANYTDAQLGVGGSLNGRAAWCQESNVAGTSRQNRGNTGLSYSNWFAPTSAVSNYGWRPCLELAV